MTKSEAGQVLLGTLDLSEAKRLRSILEDRKIELALRHNEETCSTGGCAPKVEVWAFEIDMPGVRAFLAEEQARAFDGLEFDAEVASAVFDPEQAEATCPACATKFSTKLTECPDCGLCFGGGAEPA